MSVMAETDDAHLLALVRDGDTSAMAELWSRHYPATLAAARRISRQPRDAEELASDAFSAMLQALSHDAGPSTSVRAYLQTAVRNQATSRARRASSGDVLTDEITDFEDPDHDVVDPVAHHAELGLVREAFASLPHRWQTVLWRTVVDHDSNKAVAEELGMSPNALAALARRARLGFRTAYLQVHTSSHGVAPECEPFVPRLVEVLPGAKVRRSSQDVRDHVDQCDRCNRRLVDLAAVDRDLRGFLLPALLALGPGIKWITAAGGTHAAGALLLKLGLKPGHTRTVAGVGAAAAVVIAGTSAYALTRPQAAPPLNSRATHAVTSAPAVAAPAPAPAPSHQAAPTHAPHTAAPPSNSPVAMPPPATTPLVRPSPTPPPALPSTIAPTSTVPPPPPTSTTPPVVLPPPTTTSTPPVTPTTSTPSVSPTTTSAPPVSPTSTPPTSTPPPVTPTSSTAPPSTTPPTTWPPSQTGSPTHTHTSGPPSHTGPPSTPPGSPTATTSPTTGSPTCGLLCWIGGLFSS